MYAEHYIKQSIYNYPSLYKDEDYFKSKMKVLGHVFFTNGNGLDFANTKDKGKGGYITEPSSYKKRGEWERKRDLPYGKEKFDLELVNDQYFEDKIFRIDLGMDNRDASVIDINMKHNHYRGLDPMIRVQGYNDPEAEDGDERMGRLMRMMNSIQLRECSSKESPWSPYPFSSGFFMLQKVYNGEFLQLDWLLESIELAEETIIYFNTEERFIHHSHYPTESNIRRDVRSFEEAMTKGGQPEVDRLRKLWGYKGNQTVEEKKLAQWEESRNFYLSFLEKYISKFKV